MVGSYLSSFSASLHCSPYSYTSLRLGPTRRSWSTPQTPRRPRRTSRTTRSPETPEDYEELLGSRPSTTWIPIRHCLLELLWLYFVCVRWTYMAYLFTVFLAYLCYLDWFVNALATMRVNGYGNPWYDSLGMHEDPPCEEPEIGLFSGGERLAGDVFWAHPKGHLGRTAREDACPGSYGHMS